MRKLLISTAAAGLLALPAAPVFAQASSPLSWSANVGLFSDYLFRGVSQTGGEPAVQGGFDLGYEAGPVNLYAGTWASNISWLEDAGAYTNSSLEWDFYGGVNGSIGNTGLGWDAGLIYYYYPGSKTPGAVSANTTEIYGALSWKWLSAKYSYSLSDYFGVRDITGAKSDGTWYLDLKAKYDFEDGPAKGVSVWGHYGITEVNGTYAPGADPSYNDWQIGASYTVQSSVFKDTEIGGYWSDTAKIDRVVYTNAQGYDTAKGMFVVYVKKTF
ncbi:MAG: TorF family putative porin [Betaproteobacteria bacterium]|jgi:uncharacterized protein (TIGR02001 family)|nr:TorF family putative porin [Betaproteobacteria bacterium]